MIDVHYIVLIRVDECQVNRDRIGWAPAFAVHVADDQKIAKARHPEIAIGNMKIGELLHLCIVGIALPLEAVAHEDAPALIEVFPVEQLCMILDEDVSEAGHVVLQLGR